MVRVSFIAAISTALLIAPAYATLTAQFSNDGVTQTLTTPTSTLPIDLSVGAFQLQGDIETVTHNGPGFDHYQGFVLSLEIINQSASRQRLDFAASGDGFIGVVGEISGLMQTLNFNQSMEFGRDFGGVFKDASAANGLYSLSEGGWFKIVGSGSLKLIDPIYNTPVLPEPSTWAMLVVGFGLLGGYRFRKEVMHVTAFNSKSKMNAT